MSRSYAIRIPIEVLLSHTLRSKLADFRLNFPLLEILPRAQMLELLKNHLLGRGFIETEEGLAMPVETGKSAVFMPDSMEMVLKIALPGDQEMRIYEEWLPKVEDSIRRAVETGRTIGGELGNSLDQTLARQLTDLAVQGRNEINSALKDVYRDAIKQKAAQLGSVSNVSESSEGNVYRIRIEVSQ